MFTIGIGKGKRQAQSDLAVMPTQVILPITVPVVLQEQFVRMHALDYI